VFKAKKIKFLKFDINYDIDIKIALKGNFGFRENYKYLEL